MNEKEIIQNKDYYCNNNLEDSFLGQSVYQKKNNPNMSFNNNILDNNNVNVDEMSFNNNILDNNNVNVDEMSFNNNILDNNNVNVDEKSLNSVDFTIDLINSFFLNLDFYLDFLYYFF
jgi:hypothetical protein